MTFFSLVLLVICLRAFSQLQALSEWEQRTFNTLSILLTAIASLGLGSLLRHLGSMLRWPLFARMVDSILGIAPPAGSLRLIKRHIRERRISRSTLIVTTYLVTNVVGRLSVAIFGLAYNMTDKTGIEPLIPELTKISGMKYAKSPVWANGKNFSIGDDISLYLQSDLQVSNATLNVRGNSVKYSYNLKDFQEGYAIPSNHSVHSTSNCSLIEVCEIQYWRWSNRNRTGPFGTTLGAATIEFHRGYPVLRGQLGVNPGMLESKECNSPDLYCMLEYCLGMFCPTLTETIGDNESRQILPHENFFYPINLYPLFTVSSRKSYVQSDEYLVSLSSFTSSSIGVESSNGVSDLCSDHLFQSPNETVWNGYGIWMAGLIARRVAAAIIYANTDLPMFARGPHPNQTSGAAYIRTTLEVNWLRVVIIAVFITGGIILVILTVLYYCDGVYTRDDSHLATAELLKTVINKFDDGKLMTGEELAASLDDVLEGSVSYGTRKARDWGPPVVDLASGLDVKFSPFPQK
ncbi:hypothetical protein HOY80DRAFT_1100907 [Tuber brumale]|nr:hypothetical protein HOY80DRAFT_1100907 [Tuber brumale]